ncbi:coiled-coil domain-containing protein 71 [Engraulis encrasicolus]|uniref:coiled-coil domain-containing protein 71 n=1 Tax=Engraulis encrasicolus TaxID=184585 RepID=UPI002FD45448
MDPEDQAVGRAVLSWARFNSTGETALMETLKVFNPISKDLTDSEQQMVSFLQELREEGHKPLVLKSKDVYGYRSCTAEPLTLDSETAAQCRMSKPTKRRGRKPLVKKKEVNYALLSSVAKVILKDQPKILLTNLSVDALKDRMNHREHRQLGVPAHSQCLKLTNIQGLLGGSPTARLQIQTETHNMAQSTSCPSTLSGVHRQRDSCLRKVVKVDGSFTDDEVRRKAQQIYQVNLSPVIQIQPLFVKRV